jgi:hypothetical protein
LGVTPFFSRHAVNALCDAFVDEDEDFVVVVVVAAPDELEVLELVGALEVAELLPHAAAPKAIAAVAKPTPTRRNSFDFIYTDIDLIGWGKVVILYSSFRCRRTVSAHAGTSINPP